MKIYGFLIWAVLGWRALLPAAEPDFTKDGTNLTQAYLRYLCSSSGNLNPKVFGEWPQFQPTLQLSIEGGPSGPQILTPNLLPLSSGEYQPVPLNPGKIMVQEIPVGLAPKSSPKTIASIGLQPKPGRFYTLLVKGEASNLSLQLLEDEPAVQPATKPGEMPPPPRRSLRCLVLEPGFRVKILCPEAGLQLQAEPDKLATAQDLRKGLWNVVLQGEKEKQSFATTIELDLESPGCWTLFFMRNIYGRIAPALKKDASLDES